MCMRIYFLRRRNGERITEQIFLRAQWKNKENRDGIYYLNKEDVERRSHYCP